MKRIEGLDSIRFVLAFIVLVGHMGLPLPDFVYFDSVYLINFLKLFGLIFNGPAAVIIFFILSGFVIHYPFIENYNTFNIKKFYIRRLIRITIPAVIILILAYFLKVDFKPPNFGVLWSVICEIFYYILYPLFLNIFKYLKIFKVVIISYLLTLLLLLFNLNMLREEHNGYPAFGLLSFIIGLPCWLMGCWLAENFQEFKIVTLKRIYIYRILVLFIMLILHIIKFHGPTVFSSNCFTLNLFAFIATYWLGFEIKYFMYNKANIAIEYCGKFSYSLYLIHALVPSIILYFKLEVFINLHYFILPISIIISYLFYLIIEKPSHSLAVRLSKF